MSVPDDWELSTTSEGGQVLKLANDQYLDLAIEPLFASDPEETWNPLSLRVVNANVYSVHLPDGSHVGNLKHIGSI